MNKYEIYNLESGYLITIDDEVTHYDFYDVPKQIVNIIKQLEQENNQLKEQLEKKYEKVGSLTTEILYEENSKLQSVLKELRSWLEEALNELKQNDIYDRTSYEMGQVIATECIIEKLNELEGGKNE